MLTIFRRHLKSCKFAGKGRGHRHCQCPISVEGRLDGKMIRRSLDVRSWDAAQKKVREWESAGTTTIEIPSVEEAAKRFIKDLESRGLSPDTIRKFELLKDEFTERFAGIRIDHVTPDDLGQLKESWKLRPSTAAKKLERLRSFFKFCVDREWISKNPAKALRAPKEITIVKKPYDAWELEKIAWAIEIFPKKGIYGEQNRVRIRAFTLVLRWTGLRIRDVVTLHESKFDGEHIILRTHKNGTQVKLILNPEACAALEELHATGFYFWSGEGNPKSCVGDWQRTLRRLSLLSGVHIHAHRWRHTLATDLLAKGVPVSEVAAILGNSVRIVEKHYAQWIEARQTALDVAVKGTW